jgi:cytoskeletal protein CcmA (bactofilin family)
METSMNSQPTVIGAHTRVKGTIEGEEDLHVFGRVDGTVALSGSLTVDQDAVVVADVEASQALIGGTVVGNVTAQTLIHISSTGRVVGDLTAPRVVIEDGASYRGTVDMGEVDTSRPPEGARSERSAVASSGSSGAGGAVSSSSRIPQRVLGGRPTVEGHRGMSRPAPSAPPLRRVSEERRPLGRAEPRLPGVGAQPSEAVAEPHTVARLEAEGPTVVTTQAPVEKAASQAPAPAAEPRLAEPAPPLTFEDKVPKPPTTAGRKTRARRK